MVPNARCADRIGYPIGNGPHFGAPYVDESPPALTFGFYPSREVYVPNVDRTKDLLF